MTINFNPNLLPNDAPSDELWIERMGGLILGDPDAFEEETPLTGGWDAATFNSMFDDDDDEEEEQVQEEAA
jgi:hypothetical protein